MGKKTGFMDYNRKDRASRSPAQRIQDFAEIHYPLPETERTRQAARCMDCGVPFCQSGIVFDGQRLGCPLHNLIPEWNDALYTGNIPHALARLLKTSCFPEFTGRVCPALCENACVCGMCADSVTVRDNELYIIEWAFENGLMYPQPPERRSGKRIAVVGSGPAGLSAAYWLNRRGHSVTVFERDKLPGGLLAYGIPEMKLPMSVVSRRIRLMEQEDIEFITEADIGKSIPLEKLRSEYDSVILCCGSQQPRPLSYEGQAEGVYYALDYLKASARSICGELGENPISAAGKKVIVVGAGDSASDCIATAMRQGCESVTQLIRKSASSLTEKQDYAHEEASAVYDSDIRCFESQIKSVHADAGGRLTSVTVTSPAGEQDLEADLIIIASGFSGCEDYNAVMRSSEGTICAGDMRTGSTLVVLAIADGKRAAAEADTHLMGYTNIVL